jgi:hypothetical protein
MRANFSQESQEEEEEEAVPAVSSWALLRLNAPEWRLLVGGAAASLLVGATMPTFALLLSKLYGVSVIPLCVKRPRPSLNQH